MTSVATINSRNAHLADSGATISGVAIAAGDVTHGLHGLKKWPADELKAAAASLEGTEPNLLHSEQTVGRVTAAGWSEEQQAVLYEAEVTDEKLAENFDAANLEVSIEANHASAGTADTPRGEAMLVSDIEFTGMAIVQRGASASASAEAGEQAALSAADIRAALADAEFAEGDLIRWETSASPGSGRVADVVTEPGESVSASGADVTREATEDEAAYKLDDYVGPEAGYDDGVVVKSASEILGAWEDAPEEAMAAAGGDTDDDVSPESGPSEVSTGGEPADSTGDEPTDDSQHMSDEDDNNDTQESELRATLQEKQEQIAELESQVEQLQEERADVAQAYAEALAAGDTILDADEFAERYSVAELREKVEETESATLADTEPAVQSGGGETDTSEAELSESEQAEVADHREVIADLAGKGGVAKHERQRRAELVAEKTGEDPDTILEAEA